MIISPYEKYPEYNGYYIVTSRMNIDDVRSAMEWCHKANSECYICYDWYNFYYNKKELIEHAKYGITIIDKNEAMEFRLIWG